MLLTYYTLTALAAEWAASLPGCIVADAYSQNRDELSLALDGAEEWTLVVETRPDLRLLFRNPGHGRARRNSASLFEAALGRRVEAVRTAERDRVVFVDLEDGAAFQIQLFGPRPNVWLVEDGVVTEAFQSGEEWVGAPPPAPRAAPAVATFEDFEGRWRTNRKTVEQAVAAALPLFDRTLAAEAVFPRRRRNGSAGRLHGSRTPRALRRGDERSKPTSPRRLRASCGAAAGPRRSRSSTFGTG